MLVVYTPFIRINTEVGMKMIAERIPAVFAIVFVMLIVGGCTGTAETRSTGQYIDDAAITTSVKTALFRADGVSGFQVDVDTFRGRVQLNGFVDSQAEKSRAEEVARGVEGVREVTNNLEVKSDRAPD